MKKPVIHKLFFLLLLIPCKLFSQDITGMWYGELLFMDSIPVHLPYEIAISEVNGKFKGYSRIIFMVNGKEEAGIQDISVKKNGNQFIIEDEGFIEHNFAINPSKSIKKTMILSLKVIDSVMQFTGEWSTNKTRLYNVKAKGTATLSRKNNLEASKLYMRLDTLKLAANLSFYPPEKISNPIVATAVPVQIKAATTLPESKPVEAEIILPAIDEPAGLVLAPIIKKPQPLTAKIQAPSQQQKNKYKSLTRSTLTYTAPIIPPAATVKPVAVATVKPTATATPAAASSTASVAVKTSEPEIKPSATVTVPAKPKPSPIAAAIVAPSITQGAAEIDKRVIKTQESVYFESDSLVLTLYDNGEVDGDTVTVVMNGNVIFSKQGLTTKANSKTIYINEHTPDSIKLVMYAENLGEIPPNTGLMVVMDGEKRYDVRFTADLKSNAAIILRRRKKE